MFREQRSCKLWGNLGSKLGVLLLQFPYFNKRLFPSSDNLPRLNGFLKKLPSGFKFALEIHNKTWLTPRFQQLLRSHQVTLTLIDYPVDAAAETLFRTACEKITH